MLIRPVAAACGWRSPAEAQPCNFPWSRRLSLAFSAQSRSRAPSAAQVHFQAKECTGCSDIIKSNRRLIADPKVPAKARILRQKCHLRQNSVNCDKCDNLHQNSTICIKTALFA